MQKDELVSEKFYDFSLAFAVRSATTFDQLDIELAGLLSIIVTVDEQVRWLQTDEFLRKRIHVVATRRVYRKELRSFFVAVISVNILLFRIFIIKAELLPRAHL